MPLDRVSFFLDRDIFPEEAVGVVVGAAVAGGVSVCVPVDLDAVVVDFWESEFLAAARRTGPWEENGFKTRDRQKITSRAVFPLII